MQQLSGLDALFVHNESPTTPMHISALLVYDPSTVPGGKVVRFKDILATFERSLDKSPVFRRKLYTLPFDIDQPYWIDDPDFDLEHHIRHIALPHPGDWRQLCIMLSRIHARGLDMSKPLWEAYVIEGLDGVNDLPKGSFGVFLKVHHSGIDGVSAAGVIAAIHELTAQSQADDFEDDWVPTVKPNNWQAAGNAYINSFRRPFTLMKTVRSMVPAVSQITRKNVDDEDKTRKPRTRFNASVTGYRVADGILLELDEIRAVKNKIGGVTVNDVIVTIVGGALRHYLQAHDELPDTTLTAGAPINIRKPDDTSDGNRIGVMGMSLGTDIEDPIARLGAVHNGAISSKTSAEDLGKSSLVDIAEGMSARLSQFGLKAATTIALLPKGPIPFNVIVSNVPGPPIPLYMSGAELHSVYGFGPVVNGMALFHAVISNNGKISIVFVSCRKILPDPEFYAECLQQSWQGLKQAALGKKNPGKQKKRKKRAVAKKVPKAKGSKKTTT